MFENLYLIALITFLVLLVIKFGWDDNLTLKYKSFSKYLTILLLICMTIMSIYFVNYTIKAKSFGETFTYQAQLMDGRILDAKNCSLENGIKSCEVAESYFSDKAYFNDIITVVVEDYWEKTADTK